ncbi:MAG: hypothetical protein E7242_09855 [Lachnospiraceae bacterium]|nr:hypothetical protein [Lachnospiraceae bacterium]
MEINYETYVFSKKEKIKYALIAFCIMCLFAFLFYKSVIAIAFMIPIGIFYMKNKRKALSEKRKRDFEMQFKDAILASSAALQAGYSIENSFVHAYNEMINLYGEKSYICRELKLIINNINLNIPLEQCLSELANKTQIDEVKTFNEVFSIAKRCGGDLVKIISTTANEISDKADIKSEINTIISAKKFEQKIMNFMPLLIILYVNISTGGLIETLYGNITGVIIMTVCLGIYIFAYFLGKRIVRIEV